MIATPALILDAYAGVMLRDGSGADPLLELPGDELFGTGSALLDTIRDRLIDGEVHLSFLWPTRATPTVALHVRVTYFAFADLPRLGRLGIVLLSPVGIDHGLTPRELEVLGMMVDGCSNQQIADELVVAPRTVATHVEHILPKLGSSTRTHAAVHALREGLYVPLACRPSAG